jgi:hypothetical protein
VTQRPPYRSAGLDRDVRLVVVVVHGPGQAVRGARDQAGRALSEAPRRRASFRRGRLVRRGGILFEARAHRPVELQEDAAVARRLLHPAGQTA